jgi:hypothetical protein
MEPTDQLDAPNRGFPEIRGSGLLTPPRTRPAVPKAHANDGVWRFAFAFDPKRAAILLCGGDKSGGSEQRFYRQLITKADDRFDAHLADLRTPEAKQRPLRADGVSLNQFIAVAVAEKVGVLETAQALLDRRAGKATPRDLLKFLRKARNEEPSDADRR